MWCFENLKKTDEGVLLLVKLSLLPGHFLRFLNCTDGTRSPKASQFIFISYQCIIVHSFLSLFITVYKSNLYYYKNFNLAFYWKHSKSDCFVNELLLIITLLVSIIIIQYIVKRLTPNFASNIKRINYLLFPMKSSENLWFPDDFRRNRS